MKESDRKVLEEFAGRVRQVFPLARISAFWLPRSRERAMVFGFRSLRGHGGATLRHGIRDSGDRLGSGFRA